jgi:hypothetical protein
MSPVFFTPQFYANRVSCRLFSYNIIFFMPKKQLKIRGLNQINPERRRLGGK